MYICARYLTCQTPGTARLSHLPMRFDKLQHLERLQVAHNELACVYAALILHDDGMEITGESIASILKAATDRGLEVDLSIPGFEVPSLGFRGHAFHVHRVMTMLAGLDLDADRGVGLAGAPGMERVGLVVIRPDRVRPIRHRPDAWYLTARQLQEFIVDASDIPPDARPPRDGEAAA